jgi:hypothetical protein
VRSLLEARLTALSETDSSQWPSPSRAGAIYRTQEGADRWRSSSGWTAHHRLRVFADLHESAKQRGFIGDRHLDDTMSAFSQTPSFGLLLRTACRLVQLGGVGALAPRPQPDGALKDPAEDAAQHARARGAVQGNGKCPFCGRVKRGLAAHIAAKHRRARLTPEILEASRPDPARGRAVAPARPVSAQPNASRAVAASACPLCSGKHADLAQHLMDAHKYRRYACPRCARTCLTLPNDEIVCEGCRRRFSASANREALTARASS